MLLASPGKKPGAARRSAAVDLEELEGSTRGSSWPSAHIRARRRAFIDVDKPIGHFSAQTARRNSLLVVEGCRKIRR